MAEFDEKLNSLLSNPDAMAQIMQMAQSLSGGGQPQQAPQQPVQQQPPPPPPPPSPGGDPFSSLAGLTGGMDPAMLSKLLPLIQELGSQNDSNARQLLQALRPYLRPERQEKIERALQLARLFHLGKKFLSGWDGCITVMSAMTMAHTPASPRRKTKTLPRRGQSSSQGRGRNRTSSRHIGKHRRHSLLPQAGERPTDSPAFSGICWTSSIWTGWTPATCCFWACCSSYSKRTLTRSCW